MKVGDPDTRTTSLHHGADSYNNKLYNGPGYKHGLAQEICFGEPYNKHEASWRSSTATQGNLVVNMRRKVQC